MNKFIIMGVQGCGKGTQAKMLAKDFDLVHISVGDIFRWQLQSHTKLGARIGRFTSAGELVPDDIVEEIVRGRLDQHDWNYGFILDGFPRNRRQAEFFLESYDIHAVIQLDMADQVVFDRVLNRRLCGKCGLDYNLIFHRPKADDVCDVCGGQLVSRADDTPEALRVAAARLPRQDCPDFGALQPQAVGRRGRGDPAGRGGPGRNPQEAGTELRRSANGKPVAAPA